MGMNFDPASGDYLPPGQPEPDGPPPEAYSGTTGAKVATVLFAIVLIGLGILYALVLVQGLQAALDPDGQTAQRLDDSAQGIDADILWSESATNLVFLGLIPMAWVAFTRVKPNPGTLIYLRMERTKEIGRDLLRGVGLGFGVLVAVWIIGIIRITLTDGWDTILSENATADSPLIEAFARELTWPLALFVAFVAGTAEEIFFRGVLQRWIGMWGQAIVFGLTHAGYGTIDQIIFPFALGLLFGWLIKRGHSLYMLMMAHFLFDFVQFALLMSAG